MGNTSTRPDYDVAVGKREKVESTADQLGRHPAVVVAAAAGQVVNGIVHIIIGLIAIAVARGAGGTADQGGAMRAIDSTPAGSVGLWVAGIALLALALYSIAIATGEIREDAKEAVKSAGRGMTYGAVGGMAIIYANGGSSDGEETATSVSAELMSTTWGSWVLVIVGVAVLAVGGSMVAKGVRKTFLEDVDVSGQARRVFTVFGMAGYIAKGIAVGIVGILFVVAVITNDPEEAGGLDGALKKLTELPYGTFLLIIVGAGLITYGIFCFARARALARKRGR